MGIDDVINKIRTSEVGVMSIILKDASRYAANATGEMEWSGTLFTKKYANRQPGDDVIKTGSKETNLTEIERVLKSLHGKGEVEVRLLNGEWIWLTVGDDVRKRIGKRIAELRKEFGMSQEELASRTGIQRPHITRIEAGRYSVGIDILQKIAEVFGKNVDLV